MRKFNFTKRKYSSRYCCFS